MDAQQEDPTYGARRSDGFGVGDERGLFLPFEWMTRRELGYFNVGLRLNRVRRGASKKTWTFRSRDAVGLPTRHTVYTDFSSNALYRSMNCAMRNVHLWSPEQEPMLGGLPIGAVFNFGFSPDGSKMIAACDNKTVLWMDPFTRKLLAFNPTAHNSSINYVTFIDEHQFATCSDDRTIRLWDLRKFRTCLRTLRGHEGWVKNMECYHGQLLSSSFDGDILQWDINGNPSPDAPLEPRLVFRTPSLVRFTVAERTQKLLVSTKEGFIMVIHDLDVDNVSSDLQGFNPAQYVHMLHSHDTVNLGNPQRYTPLFSSRNTRNRPELITDFHQENDADYIVSIKVDPHETCVLTRNIDKYEASEYTCVHDLSDFPKSRRSSTRGYGHGSGILKHIPQRDLIRTTGGEPMGNESPSLSDMSSLSDVSESVSGETVPAAAASEFQISQPVPLSSIRGLGLENYADRLPRINIVCSEALAQMNLDLIRERVTRIQRDYQGRDTDITLVLNSSDAKTFVLANEPRAAMRFVEVHKNKPRLLYYTKENYNRASIDFIKEVGFSSDGRVIVSPLPRGIHLLSFDENSREAGDITSDREAKELTEIASFSGHPSIVMSTRFSPVHTMCVSGCLAGHIGFYQPVL